MWGRKRRGPYIGLTFTSNKCYLTVQVETLLQMHTNFSETRNIPGEIRLVSNLQRIDVRGEYTSDV